MAILVTAVQAAEIVFGTGILVHPQSDNTRYFEIEYLQEEQRVLLARAA